MEVTQQEQININNMEKKAKRTAAKGQNESIVVQHIDIRQIQRTTQDVGKWRNALIAAESIYNPTRRLLYDLYHDLILDAQLLNCTNARRRAVTNAKLKFTNSKGDEIEQVQNLIESPVFFSMLQDLIDARFWGFSLLEFYQENGELKYYLAERKHVKPEMGIVVKTPYDTIGLQYNEPPLNNYIITAGETKDLGLYLSAAQYVIYKRGNFGDWAQFNELFGIPPRYGYYDGQNDDTRQKLENALKNMGSAAYGVFPEGTRIETGDVKNAAANGEVFEKLKNAADEQIALILLGQTMTTKDGSSLSQAQVHAEVAEQVFKDDQRFILNTLNHDFKRILKTFGFPTDGEFNFVDNKRLSLKDRVYIDTQISQILPLPPEHWFKTYDIEKPEDYEKLLKAWRENPTKPSHVSAINQNDQQRQQKQQEQKQKLKIVAEYNPPEANVFNIPFIAASKNQLSRNEWKTLNDEAARIAELIYNGALPENYYISKTMVDVIYNHLEKAIIKGYAKGVKFAGEGIDATTLKALKENIYHFSAAKNYNQLQAINGLLLDNEGKQRTLNQFKQAVENLNIKFNQNWQATEYNAAVASSQMAEKWNSFQRDAEQVPVLTWKWVKDERTRQNHKINLTAPANDPIWEKYWPPLDWGCRCDVIQVADETVKTVKPENMPEVVKGFEGNSGQQNEIFTKKHPYFKGVPKEVAENIFKFKK